MPENNRYAFLVEWLDPQAQLVRQYLLFYYSIDATVEMVSGPCCCPDPCTLGAWWCDLRLFRAVRAPGVA